MTAPPPGKTEFVAKIFEWLNALDDGQKFLTILITFLTMLGTAFGVGVSFGIWLSHKKDISGTITDPPKDQKLINHKITVKGTISRKINSDEHLWLVVNPVGYTGWYPGSSEIFPDKNKRWIQENLYIGLKKSTEQKFTLFFILCSDSANTIFKEYLEKTAHLPPDKWPIETLPNGITKLDERYLIRK
ncbi:MAG: hypothetical protein DWQ51_21110 [Microcystis wesenbergii TW10]|jgi:hypothetical protein|uniref:Uncharacterized protein n=3 Tax=Microcystis TaxID=1125 RepID=A0ABU3HG02_9CHRO|nr:MULTISPECIES: hypothetical protein [Microcystis]REJ47159.1 MAG: hypothetical protein DWQ51_21110 [Microcystis wesenbergii TW10]MBD2116656.1 hypothetical protein [Microcystis wesenbergii FACHB-1339]MCZ8037064.1 hypothetical protein [Microcystis sp. LE17-20A]MCZ8118032.1 hypothetical protein [Microcystis sp. LE18-22.4A]MCZ8212288.1 hypothetical protein [Microcystis sp. LE19-8.1F]